MDVHRTGLLVLLSLGLTLFITGCSNNSAKSPSQTNSANPNTGHASEFPAPAALAKLGNMTNYAFTYKISGGATPMTLIGKVANPTNYEVDFNSFKTIYIHNQVYTYMKSLGWTKGGVGSNYPFRGVVAQLKGLLKASGTHVKQTGSLKVAGTSATAYTIYLGQPQVTQTYQIALSNSTGVLLSDKSVGADFEITQIGGIAPFSVPSKLVNP